MATIKDRFMENYIIKLNKIHNLKYLYPDGVVGPKHTKIRIICLEHGEFYQTIKDHMNGHGCKRCGYKKLSLSNAMQLNDFIARANDVHNFKYDYSKTNYRNLNTKVVIICPKHGEFEQLPSNHLHNHGCYQCAFDYDFIKKAHEVHADRYDYSLTNYNGSNAKIDIICKSHGKFRQRPADHIRGSGCPICGNESLGNNFRLSQEEFIIKAKEVHGEKYDYSVSIFKDMLTKVLIRCPKHGLFEQLPSNHIYNVNGCPQCIIEDRTLTKNEFIEKARLIHSNKYDYSLTEYINTKTKIKIICKDHGEFEQIAGDHLGGHGCIRCPIVVSSGHQGLIDFISNITNNIEINVRNVIQPYEIDIYSASMKIGFEFDGVFWHSYNRRENASEIYRHFNKRTLCEQAGIDLFQIWENEWTYKNNIIKSMITNKLGKIVNKIGARACDIKELTSNEFNEFMQENHLQGTLGTRTRYGLVDKNGKLVCAIGLNRHQKYDYEITRLATLLNYNVIGGATKLWSHFLKIYNPKSVLSYANRRYSNGSIYKRLGFKLDGITPPGYYYTKGDKIFSRVHFQKHKLSNILSAFDPNLSEPQNMFNNKYRRIWDSGNYRFIYSAQNR